MSLLKHVDRIAKLSLLSACLGLPAAAQACSVTSAPLSYMGRILAAAQVLTDANFRRINVGMSAAEVLERIGPPSRKMRFAGTRTTSWDYHFPDLWNYDSEFSVIFNDRDIVVSKFTERTGQ